MAKVTLVKKARKAPGSCRVCGKEIEAGDSYKWVHPRYRSKVVACVTCQIPRAMVSSSKMAPLLDEIDGINMTDAGEMANTLRGLAESAREIGEEYQESADNQREYFPESPTADENEERAQNLEEWAASLEQAADEIDEKITELDELREERDAADPDTDQERLTQIDGEIEELESDIESIAGYALGECPE